MSFGFPSVNVPVLSNAIVVISPKSSKAFPPLIKTPFWAALAIPLKTALGVEIAKAQGLAATKTVIARYKGYR